MVLKMRTNVLKLAAILMIAPALAFAGDDHRHKKDCDKRPPVVNPAPPPVPVPSPAPAPPPGDTGHSGGSNLGPVVAALVVGGLVGFVIFKSQDKKEDATVVLTDNGAVLKLTKRF